MLIQFIQKLMIKTIIHMNYLPNLVFEKSSKGYTDFNRYQGLFGKL